MRERWTKGWPRSRTGSRRWGRAAAIPRRSRRWRPASPICSAPSTRPAETLPAEEPELFDADLGERITAIEQSLERLSQQVEAAGNADARMARIAAATALKAAIDQGGPFQDELDTYAAVAPQSPLIEELRPYAEEGVATRAALISAMPDAASAMITAARPMPEDAGFFDRLLASARSLVSVRPIGDVEGESVPATVARMEAAVAEGNYERALAEYDSLPEAARQAAPEFAARLRARHAADEVVLRALADALRPA